MNNLLNLGITIYICVHFHEIMITKNLDKILSLYFPRVIDFGILDLFRNIPFHATISQLGKLSIIHST